MSVRAVPSRTIRLLVGALLLLVSAGCSTYADRILTAREQFYTGQVGASAETFSSYIVHHPRDADAAALDLAIVQLASGQPQQAELTLRRVRDRFEELEQADAAEITLSMLTDDQQLAYAGENYEKVLTRVFLALVNLLQDGQDAEAYSLQINAKQEALLQQVPEEERELARAAYVPLAIGPYVHGMIREASFGNYDDASRAYQQVVSWQPDFQAGRADLARAQHGVHSRPGHGVVYVFALCNRGPVKEQSVEIPTSAAMLVADRVLSMFSQYDVTPTLAPIKVPRVVVPSRQVDRVVVQAGGQALTHTEVICDVGDLALRQQELNQPKVIGRAVARRAIKKAAIYATKSVVEADAPMADLALSVVGVAWEAAEAADTRCWGLLPREIQVARLELPAGTHELQLSPALTSRQTVLGPTVSVDVQDGRNSYVLACFPGPQLVGQVLTHTP